jgi:hypothetical protein
MSDNQTDDNRKKWLVNGIEFIEPSTKQNDPMLSYGVVDIPKPTDTLYRLTYDSDLRYLKLNGFTVQTFQFESKADKCFNELFNESGEVKTINVHKPAKADVLVNNINMPIKLRNAIFTTGIKGTRLQVHTIVTRERAIKFGVNQQEINDYIDKSRDAHYKLLNANKRK